MELNNTKCIDSWKYWTSVWDQNVFFYEHVWASAQKNPFIIKIALKIYSSCTQKQRTWHYLKSLGCSISHCQWTGVQTRGRRKHEQLHSLIYATKNNKNSMLWLNPELSSLSSGRMNYRYPPPSAICPQRAWAYKEPESTKSQSCLTSGCFTHSRLLRIICYSVHQSPDWNRIKQKLSKNEQFSFDYTYDNHPHQKKTFTSTVHISFHREWISALLQLRHHVTDSIPYRSE